MNFIRRLLAVALAGTATVLGLAACGSTPIVYEPAAFGVPGHCYYLQSPAEAIALQNTGLCPRTWVPTLMPLAWEEEYFAYYSSPSYFDHYVSVRYRTSFIHLETTFYSTHHVQIITLEKKAIYRTSAGKTVSGSKVMTGKAKFGSGSSFGGGGQRYGGGSLRGGRR